MRANVVLSIIGFLKGLLAGFIPLLLVATVCLHLMDGIILTEVLRISIKVVGRVVVISNGRVAYKKESFGRGLNCPTKRT